MKAMPGMNWLYNKVRAPSHMLFSMASPMVASPVDTETALQLFAAACIPRIKRASRISLPARFSAKAFLECFSSIFTAMHFLSSLPNICPSVPFHDRIAVKALYQCPDA